MALETSDIIDLVRLELDDPELPGNGNDSDSLWSNTEIAHYLDEAQREFARETLCLSDFSNFASLTVTASNPWITIDDRIVEIRSAYLNSSGSKLVITTVNEIERGDIGHSDYGMRSLTNTWQSAVGNPQYLITDLEYGRGRLYPIPTVNDSIALSVYREPLEEIEGPATDMEIPERFRRALIHKACALAFAKDDAETHNDAAINKRLMLWQKALDEALSFFRKKNRRAPITSYGGI